MTQFDLMDAVFTSRSRKVATYHRDRACNRRLRAAQFPPASWDARYLRAKADESDRAAVDATAGKGIWIALPGEG